jgi:F0F1-type ATP synthase assembly protein I
MRVQFSRVIAPCPWIQKSNPLAKNGKLPNAKKFPKEDPDPNSSQWLEFLNLGWVFAGAMTLTVGGGIWLDRHFQTMPILLLVGTFIGFLGCGYSLYRVIQKLNRNEGDKSAK